MQYFPLNCGNTEYLSFGPIYLGIQCDLLLTETCRELHFKYLAISGKNEHQTGVCFGI